MKRGLGIFFVLVLSVCAAELWRLTGEIARESSLDEARPVDAIVVYGAAEYRGKPSPVLKARLDHALDLYRRGIAPRIITTGGAGGDPLYTEGEVGRSYLSQHGVPVESIVVESESETTAQSSLAVAEIMKRMGLRTCVVVSDGYHIYRAKRMLQQRGVVAYGSPRPMKHSGKDWEQRWLFFRQAVGYGLWSMGIRL
ncbi:MAG: YdcF family protein [Bryobacteraceae bacterium]|nr:YdcF family protein [Bryobacteraceae bacterium]MDW8379354.1 YdcF family protein [Bryobacterales bacterium]